MVGNEGSLRVKLRGFLNIRKALATYKFLLPCFTDPALPSEADVIGCPRVLLRIGVENDVARGGKVPID